MAQNVQQKQVSQQSVSQPSINKIVGASGGGVNAGGGQTGGPAKPSGKSSDDIIQVPSFVRGNLDDSFVESDDGGASLSSISPMSGSPSASASSSVIIDGGVQNGVVGEHRPVEAVDQDTGVECEVSQDTESESIPQEAAGEKKRQWFCSCSKQQKV